MCGELTKVVHRFIIRQCPIEGEFVTAVGIIGKIARVYAIGDYKKLDVIKQTVERGLLIALNLVICLLQFYASLFEFNLNERQTIDENGDIVSAGLTTFDSNLIGYLKLVLAPMVLVEKLYPDAMPAILCLQRIEVAKLLGFFKEGAAFKINAYFLELFVREGGAPYLRQRLGVMFFKLSLEIAI